MYKKWLLFLCIVVISGIQWHDTIQEISDKTVVIATTTGEVEKVADEVQKAIPAGTVRIIYEHALNGFSMELPETDMKRLKEMKYIERVDRIVTYEATVDESVPFIGGDEIRNKLDERGKRLTGKGVKVAVIDTGIDYRHPDLKRNYKGGYDVIDYDDDPMETTGSEGTPTMHGTHVAGIIAANGKVKGVAPEADIYAYRALGPGGQGTTEQVLSAIEKAIVDNVDVINLSLGNTVNGPDWPTSLALDEAVDKGIVAVTSNGNSGPKMWTVGSPGTSTKAISVGASTPPVKTPYVTLPGMDREVTLYPMGGAAAWEFTRDFPLIHVGYGLEEDWNGKEVEGKVVLIERGLISLFDKVRLAKEAGAKAVIIYNNLPGSFVGMVETNFSLPVVTIAKEDGDWLKEQWESENEYAHVRTVYRNEEDLIAPFSSRGPVTHTWEVKPDLVAPGVAIHSTVPDGYFGLNGTSMSAPHVAGAAALLLQAHPEWTPEQVKAALMNTAKKLTNEDGEPYLPFEQGAGRLQINEALESTTLVYPSALTFGKWSKDDPREKRTASFIIENDDDVTQTYYVSPPIAAPDGLQWEVPFSITLQPKRKAKVHVHLDLLPAVLEEGIHHGDIIVEGGKKPISVPYVFFIEEPDYPRVMAFNFGHGDEKNTYRYELYLPGGAEEMKITLYDSDTFEFLTVIDEKKNIGRGIVAGEWKNDDILPGTYKALVYAKQDEKEDTIETFIHIS